MHIWKLKRKKKNYGELLLAGSHKMLGYLDNIKSPDTYHKGKKFYKTGDIVFLDKNKNINFIGRKSDYIKISGYRVNLSSLERIIKRYLKLEMCLISKFDKIHMFIFNKKDQKILKHLDNIFKKYFERYEIPSSISFLNKMPINSNGKLDKVKLGEIIR